MKVTPLSKEPYYPMLLANGRDSLLLDHTGNCFLGLSGHSHLEQNQGTPCGWYKVGNRTRHEHGRIQSLFTVGVQVFMFDAPAEPRWFEQDFDPKTATLTTELTFFTDVKLRLTSFLTNDSLWCQRMELLACPANRALDLGFVVAASFSGCGALALPLEAGFSAAFADGVHRFDYASGSIRGAGFMLTTPCDDATGGAAIWHGVRTGFTAECVITAADDSEWEDYSATLKQRLSRAALGFDALHAGHRADWAAYFDAFSVTLPDARAQYLFELSRYILRGSQHPDSGMIGLGNLPNLWGGGLFCSADAWYGHHALLRCGDREGAARYLESFVKSMDHASSMLRELGLPGTAFAGWDDCCGRFTRKDFARYVTHYKPSFSAYAVIAAWWQEWYHPGSTTADVHVMVSRVIDFLRAVALIEDDGPLRLKPMSSGNESGATVEVDTFHQLLIGRALEMAGELLARAELSTMGQTLVEGVDVNMTSDGVLMPYRGAPYTAGLQFIFALLLLPGKLDIRSIDETIRRGRTPWGINSEQTTEETRHWPWNNTQAVICYAREGRCHEAMEHLLELQKWCSSLGAIPEKIRLDGAVIGYWYTTVHAIYQWAVCDALALMDGERLMLGYGFDERFPDFSVDGLALPGALTLSYRVEACKLTQLTLHNASGVARTLPIFLNPCFDAAALPGTVTVPAAGVYSMSCNAPK